MTTVRYRTGWSRLIPSLGFHHCIMMVIVVATALTAILLAGAGPTSIAHRVYVMQLAYLDADNPPRVSPGAWENITIPAFDAVKNTDLTVRLGYFGVCATIGGSWRCRESAVSLMVPQGPTDPLGMTSMAEKVKDDVLFPGFLIGSAGLAVISLFLFSFFPGWQPHDEPDLFPEPDVKVTPFSSRAVLKVLLGCTGLACLFTFTAALWQHTAVATAVTVLEISAVSVIKGSVGGTATGLVWTIFGLWSAVFFATLIMWMSMKLLDSLLSDM